MSNMCNKNNKMGAFWRALAIAEIAFFVTPAIASSDEMTVVFDQLLSNPDDPALNIRYAELAMAQGETRKAFAAYERVLARDPNNSEVRRAYKKAKRKLQPAVTAFTLSTGFSYETNPRQVRGSSAFNDDDFAFETSLVMFDERSLAGHRWRTLGQAGGRLQFDLDDLNDAYLSLVTGPVFELGARTKLHVAPGAATAWLDDDWVYRDALLRVSLERLYKGATQSVSAVIKDRKTNSKFGGDDGLIVQLNGRFVRANTFRKGDTLYFLPRFQYSKPSGSGPGRVFRNALFPGDFIEYGGRVVYYKPVAGKRVILGAGIGVYQRDYNQNVVAGTKDRKDVMVEPSAHLIIPNIAGSKFDFRMDYRYEQNDSNDSTEDFDNNVFSAKTVRRF